MVCGLSYRSSFLPFKIIFLATKCKFYYKNYFLDYLWTHDFRIPQVITTERKTLFHTCYRLLPECCLIFGNTTYVDGINQEHHYFYH